MKMKKMKVLMVTAEAEPFAKTGGLGDVLGALPQALKQQEIDVRVLIPRYKIIPPIYREKMKYLGYIYLDVNWRHQYCGIFSLKKEGVTYYFLDNEFYFGSDHLYDEMDLERFSFLSYGAFELLSFLNFQPDILHLHDWHTGAIAALFDYKYRHLPFYQNMKIVYTIHNLQYQGKFDVNHVKDMLPLSDVYYDGYLANFMAWGIRYAHKITTVSPSYKDEIQTDQYGEGLNGLLYQNKDKLIGVLNGIDEKRYNPELDNEIYYKYTKETVFQIKPLNKKMLLQELQIDDEIKVPLIGVVTRLATQKGIDLIIGALYQIFKEDIRVVVLGSGDKNYEQALLSLMQQYPTKLKVVLKFDNTLAHKIYAGSDLFLMPSIFEPCGLAQMICLKYGTLPIVREVGGLKDTIQSYDEYRQVGNGFSFTYYNLNDFIYTIYRAIGLYYKKDVFCQIMENAMNCDFSWHASAIKYKKIYSDCLKGKKE